MPWDKRGRCDLPLLQGDYIGEGGVKTSVNFLKITFQYLTLDIMHLGADSRRTVLPGRGVMHKIVSKIVVLFIDLDLSLGSDVMMMMMR